MTTQIPALTKDLIIFQNTVPTIYEVDVNSHRNSTYAALETILDAIGQPLRENGLCISHSISYEDGKNFLITDLLHVSGEFRSSKRALSPTPEAHLAKDGSTNWIVTEQAICASITYARRSSILAILGIETKKAEVPSYKNLDNTPEKKEPPPGPPPNGPQFACSQCGEPMTKNYKLCYPCKIKNANSPVKDSPKS